jgi:PleD family two-component response regulator
VGEDSCEWLELVEELRRQVSELSELVSTDALTGLFNFRYFKMVLQAEMDRSKRSGIPTSLVIVDADHFKAVNDTFGHEIGNQALQHLADILRNEVRTTDIVCRYGGEEFAIIFQGGGSNPRGNCQYPAENRRWRGQPDCQHGRQRIHENQHTRYR